MSRKRQNLTSKLCLQCLLYPQLENCTPLPNQFLVYITHGNGHQNKYSGQTPFQKGTSDFLISWHSVRRAWVSSFCLQLSNCHAPVWLSKWLRWRIGHLIHIVSIEPLPYRLWRTTAAPSIEVSVVLLCYPISNYLVDPGPLDKRTLSQIVPKMTICTKQCYQPNSPTRKILDKTSLC